MTQMQSREKTRKTSSDNNRRVSRGIHFTKGKVNNSEQFNRLLAFIQKKE
jgi:hypothetical protein